MTFLTARRKNAESPDWRMWVKPFLGFHWDIFDACSARFDLWGHGGSYVSTGLGRFDHLLVEQVKSNKAYAFISKSCVFHEQWRLPPNHFQGGDINMFESCHYWYNTLRNWPQSFWNPTHLVGSHFWMNKKHGPIWGFPKMVVPPKHPKFIMFSRKTHGCWVPPF